MDTTGGGLYDVAVVGLGPAGDAAAEQIVERGGFRIGVFRDINLDHVDRINFHGLTIRHKLPTTKEV
ncbi:MAG TPA: hypothetical protein PKC36_15215, partial [Dietzia sp.]|nr:hypothetical protein [Dietzia sp.]